LICTALRKAPLEIRDRGIDLRAPPIAPLIEWKTLAPHPSADCLDIKATGGGNLAEGLPLGKTRLDLLIAVQTCDVPGLLLLLEPRGASIAGQRLCDGSDLQ
jgi:hypothetical protein